MCTSSEAKRFSTLCFSSIDYGQYLGYGRVQVFTDLTHVHNTSDMVESGYYLYRCANWSLYPGGVKTGELVHKCKFLGR